MTAADDDADEVLLTRLRRLFALADPEPPGPRTDTAAPAPRRARHDADHTRLAWDDLELHRPEKTPPEKKSAERKSPERTRDQGAGRPQRRGGNPEAPDRTRRSAPPSP